MSADSLGRGLTLQLNSGLGSAAERIAIIDALNSLTCNPYRARASPFFASLSLSLIPLARGEGIFRAEFKKFLSCLCWLPKQANQNHQQQQSNAAAAYQTERLAERGRSGPSGLTFGGPATIVSSLDAVSQSSPRAVDSPGADASIHNLNSVNNNNNNSDDINKSSSLAAAAAAAAATAATASDDEIPTGSKVDAEVSKVHQTPSLCDHQHHYPHPGAPSARLV